MFNIIDIAIRFLDPSPIFHGRRDGGEPEWPPSPLRLFQALVDGAASRWRDPKKFSEYASPALGWLQRLHPPEIVAPPYHRGTAFRIAVPNNDLDTWAGPISKGNAAKKQPNELKTMKTIHPTRIRIGFSEHDHAIHYLYRLPAGECTHLMPITLAARSITHLGWGVDMAVGDVRIISVEQADQLLGQRWRSSPNGGTPLRTPTTGTLDDLARRHTDFLGRIVDGGYRPVPPLQKFNVFYYRRTTDVPSRPTAVFKLLDDNDDTYRHPQANLIHIAGMVRHIAIDAMKRNPPPGLTDPDGWVNRYVAGHQDRADKEVDLPHAQLSYLPLQSIGHPHTDPGVRQVMIAAPVGDGAILKHLCRHLDGLRLIPERPEDLRGPVFLSRVLRDNVASFYTAPSKTWASVTPVILPGHDDHKPDKTRRLILKALQQSGIDQPCEFEWNAFSVFPKSLSAHKYDRHKRPAGYIRPDHLLNLSAVHLRIRFENGQQVPGPLAIGAGRHCGLGIFARVDQSSS